MTKKDLNQNGINAPELINSVEPDFFFNNAPINRLKIIENSKDNRNKNKLEQIAELRKQIYSIENCNIKKQSEILIMGDGDINSPIMLIGETPGEIENKTGHSFQGEVGLLLKKMLSAININIEKVYTSYAINFRTPEDRKPNTQEIKRYSIFLKEHISIIDPKIVVLMGGTAMEAVTGLSTKISNERGKWKEIILKNKTLPILITFSPSYLIRFPENKKYSWEDLKKIRQKISDLEIKI